MEALAQNVDVDQFFRDLAQAPQRILMLDYDGTLAPFQIDPADAFPYPGVCERIDAIMDDPRTCVILISGRWIRDLMPVLTLKQLPEIWGSHGWENLQFDGQYKLTQIDDLSRKGLLDVDTWVPQIELAGGRCERKPGSLAVHWRGLGTDQITDIRRIVFDNWTQPGPHQNLMWRDFDGGIELRAAGRNKGYAVEQILSNVNRVSAAYLGDDLTDEDAFKAIDGRGLSVLVRPQYRPTSARLWLRPPDDLLDFLDRWHTTCKSSR